MLPESEDLGAWGGGGGGGREPHKTTVCDLGFRGCRFTETQAPSCVSKLLCLLCATEIDDCLQHY